MRERLRTSGVAATVGVAGTDHGVRGVAEAYPDAQRCLTTLLTLGRVGEVSDAAGLGVARLLLGDNGPRAVEEFLGRTLGPLLDYDERRGTDLVGTLDAWYAAGERQAETAKRLHVHPNTVVQRLDRVDRLVGTGWREPARGLDLRLALRLLRLKGGDLPH
jgi:DNA-binding PucR family transcriptional regulator